MKATPRLVIRQIQALKPHARYVVVFNQPLTQAQMDELITICKKQEIQILVLNDAKIVPLEQMAIVLPTLQANAAPNFEMNITVPEEQIRQDFETMKEIAKE